MNEERIGRNYAEVLLTLARKSGEQEEWGALIDAISVGMREDHTLRTFLESPKLAAARKIQILEKALGGGPRGSADLSALSRDGNHEAPADADSGDRIGVQESD